LSDFDPQIYYGGFNADFWGPMAWTVIFGLVFATFLTLVIVPVMYLIVDKIKLRAFDKRQEANLNRNKDQQQKEKEQKFALTQQ
jgi:Cu/Ag efflux pump CusA